MVNARILARKRICAQCVYYGLVGWGKGFLNLYLLSFLRKVMFGEGEGESKMLTR